MRYYFLLLTLWAHTLAATAQAYFNQRYQQNIPGAQLQNRCIALHDSGYVTAGIAYQNPTPDANAIILSFLDQQGRLRYNRYFGQSGYVYWCGLSDALQRLPDGGYVLVGNRVAPAIPQLGATMIWRFNAQGDTLWTRVFRTMPFGEGAIGVHVRPNGDLLLVGRGGLNSSGLGRMLLTCTDAQGNVKWQKTHGSTLQTTGRQIKPTPDGGYLIGGLGFDGQYDAYVAKVDSVGNLLWQRYLGSPTLDDTNAVIAVLPDGTYQAAVSGAVRLVGNTTYRRHFVYRFDSAGRLLRSRIYGPEGIASNLYAAHVLPDGSCVLAGQQDDTTAQAMPVATLLKLCPNGDSLWQRTYKILQGPDSHNYLSDLRPTPDGGFVASGFLFTYPPDTGTADGWVFKIDSAGYLQPGGPPVTVQCRPITGTSPAPPAQPKIDLYPNPTGPDGRFSLEAPPGATLTLTDALGRQVWRKTHLALRTSDLELPHPGLYLLRLAWPDGRSVTRKLVME